jgi:hypothetical protein
VTPSAATAPPMIGPHEMAEAEDSVGLAAGPVVVRDMSTPSANEQGEQDDDRNWDAEHPEQNSATHDNSPSMNLL